MTASRSKKTNLKKGVKPQLDLDSAYKNALPALNALRREAEFALAETLTALDLKIHLIEGRVKTVSSIVQKAANKRIDNPLQEIFDIVGIRVVCLFRNDMESIDQAIRDVFNVLSVDDKVNHDTETFGYMSSHYICSMRDDYSGPRYDQLKDLKFEIQVRTLGMHAWAAVSHHLSYKGDWDIPDQLKKSLNALSGLFYIADNEFQAAFLAREESLSSTTKRIEKSYDEPINLDSLMAYLVKKFPDRENSPPAIVSDLVKELSQAGYETIDQVDRDIDRATKAFALYEIHKPPQSEIGRKFADAGVVRGSLRIVSKAFRSLDQSDPDRYSDYEHLVEA